MSAHAQEFSHVWSEGWRVRFIVRRVLTAVLSFIVSSHDCQAGPAPVTHIGPPASWRLDRSTFDISADPCGDFYQYVCGGWARSARVPADRPSASWIRDLAESANQRSVMQLLRSGGGEQNLDVRRLRTFFASCMAQAGEADRAAGLATLRRWLAVIEKAQTPAQLVTVLRQLHEHGIAAFFQYSGEPDRTNNTRFRAEISQGLLGLNIRSYSDVGATASERRMAYRHHIARMLELSGIDSVRAAREARAVVDLESALAAVSISFSDRFDPRVSEHPTTISDLVKLAPHIDWAAYLKMVGYSSDAPLNVTSTMYLRGLDELLAGRPIDVLRAYMRWQFLHTLGPALPDELGDEYYRFASWPLVQQRSRSSECELATLKALGVELSRQFSLRFVGSTVREQARSIVEHVQQQVVGSLDAATWLSSAAQAATAEKVRRLDIKVAFPDTWPATSSFPLHAGAFLENVLAAQEFEQHRAWARARSPRRAGSWEITVYPNAAPGLAAARLVIPNGFPDQFTNSIIFTAALFQPPLFDIDAPPEVRYGMFGTVVGHEIVHVLENHDFNALGEAHDLWSDADAKAHASKAACLIEQGNRFVAFDTRHLDGRLTFDENVADLAGVPYAYAAMARQLGSHISERGADGFTPAQRFFITYAQQWCSAERPEYVRERLDQEPHAPSRFRVNGPLSNLPAFADAFSCSKDAPMVRAQSARCVIW